MSRLNSFIAGVKVLDLSQYIPGPLATLFLADMGAEVLKIEPPAGDAMQELGPRDAEGQPVFYRALNAGKSVRRLDLKSAEGRDAFLRLVPDVDVLVEGFRPGVMARLGINYDVLREINPQLVYCSMNGYGTKGSFAQVPGHDGNYLALAGVLDRNGEASPMFFDPPVADVSSSLFAVMAILGALNGRRDTGKGCEIDLALADVIMPLQLVQIADYAATGHVPVRCGTYLNGGAAYYRLYRTADGRYVMLGAVEQKFWEAFCRAANRPEWIARHHEPIPQSDLTRDLDAFFGTLSLAECIERFSDAGCCFSPVLDLGEALGQPRIRDRGLVVVPPGKSELQALFPVLIDGEPPKLRGGVQAIE